jgi:hypothetical protein
MAVRARNRGEEERNREQESHVHDVYPTIVDPNRSLEI